MNFILPPCPFCHCEADLWHVKDNHGITWYFVYCINEFCGECSRYCLTSEEAIEDWYKLADKFAYDEFYRKIKR